MERQKSKARLRAALSDYRYRSGTWLLVIKKHEKGEKEVEVLLNKISGTRIYLASHDSGVTWQKD